MAARRVRAGRHGARAHPRLPVRGVAARRPALAAAPAPTAGTTRSPAPPRRGPLGRGRRRARRRQLVADAWAVLRDGASATLDDDRRRQRDWPVCEALLMLLAAQRRGLRRRGRRARPHARRPATGSGPGPTSCSPAPGRCPAVPTHRLRVLPKVRTPPGGISFRSLSRYLCLRGRRGGRRLAQGAGAAVGHSASSRPTCCCCRGRCGSGSATSGRCRARSAGRRTSRSASSSSPRPSRSTSTWSSGCSAAPSTRSTASTR